MVNFDGPKKICKVCAQDCSDSPRFKDEQGQYIHESCYHQQQTDQLSANEQPRYGFSGTSSMGSMSKTRPRKSTITSKNRKRRDSGGGLLELLISFDGRVSRLQFWMVGLGLFILNAMIAAASMSSESLVLTIFSLLLFWPGLVVGIKRWHDRDKSGFWMLIGFIPIVGWAWAIIELGCLKGTDGPNSYGNDPT